MGWYHSMVSEQEGVPNPVYHLCPKKQWKDMPGTTYFPPNFAKDKFIHSTAIPSRLVETANCFYSKTSPPAEEWICLRVNTMALFMGGVETKLETAAAASGDNGPKKDDNGDDLVCPHICGGIPHECVTKVFPVTRDRSDGTFLAVPGVTDQPSADCGCTGGGGNNARSNGSSSTTNNGNKNKNKKTTSRHHTNGKKNAHSNGNSTTRLEI